jgi:hypothetical protein
MALVTGAADVAPGAVAVTFTLPARATVKM